MSLGVPLGIAFGVVDIVALCFIVADAEGHVELVLVLSLTTEAFGAIDWNAEEDGMMLYLKLGIQTID